MERQINKTICGRRTEFLKCFSRVVLMSGLNIFDAHPGVMRGIHEIRKICGRYSIIKRVGQIRTIYGMSVLPDPVRVAWQVL